MPLPHVTFRCLAPALALAALPACAPPPPPPPAQPEPLPVIVTHGSGSSEEVRTHEPSAPAEAARHREGCAGSVPAMCHAAALDAYNAPSSPETDKAAFDLFTRGCALGYAPSCNGVGVLYAQGRGVAKDPVHAAQLYRDACIAGSETACGHLGEALQRGVGVSKDEAAAGRADARAKCLSETSLGKGDAGTCPAL